MKYIISIDQGTTGSRAVAYDRTGKQVFRSYQEFKQYFPKPGWVEHDPEDIWRSVNSTLQDILSHIPSSSVDAIGITNQRETTVMWDRETGIPVYNAIVWQCRRTAERCEQLKKKHGTMDFFKKRTGLPIDAYFSATKIEWLLKRVPGLASRARQGEICFGTTDSWILWKLTGGKIHATDYTNASRTMLFNIQTLEWDREILDMFDIPPAILPEIKKSSGFFGVTSALGKLKQGVPVAGMAGDQQASLFGQACFNPGSVKNTYGTGAFMLLNTGHTRPVSKNGLITTLGCGLDGGPVYVLEGAVFIAGAAIQWLRDGLKIISSAAESEEMARKVSDNQGVYFVPAFVGLGAPYWNQDVRGALFGITRGISNNHLVRAALEAMCYQTKDVLTAMEKDSGLKIKELKVDGGAAANNFLCQFQADILGIPLFRPEVIETTSLGAAYLAGLATGYWKSGKEIGQSQRRKVIFKPRMPKREAREYYRGWTEAIQKLISS